MTNKIDYSKLDFGAIVDQAIQETRDEATPETEKYIEQWIKAALDVA